MARRGEDTKERILDSAQHLVMDRGFAATSVDDIIKATGLTKGAFFHHFPSKADLARALVQRYADEDLSVFDDLSARADALTDDPLQRALLFLTLFEEFVEEMESPFPGCMFASYIYESRLFDTSVHELIAQALTKWQAHYERKFAELIAVRPPKTKVDAGELAEMAVCIIEGAFLIARANDDAPIIVRQSRNFRKYLQLLFAD